MSEETTRDPNEQFLYSSYLGPADKGDIFYKQVRVGFLRVKRTRFKVTRVETEVGVFRDYETNKIRPRRYNHYGVLADE